MGNQLGALDRPQYVGFERDSGNVRITIGTDRVMKEFRHNDAIQRVSKLVEIYKKLKEKGVQHVDTLVKHKLDGKHPYVCLEPVGMDTSPASGFQCISAVTCLLKALKVMHSDPPVYHRDIRRPNIMKNFDSDEWFLIDLSDASMTPTCAVTHLREAEHSPRVRQDNHGAEVDIWGVAKYMEDLASRKSSGIVQRPAVRQIARKWMDDHAMTAESALDEIEAARHLFIGRPTAQPEDVEMAVV